MPQRQVLPGRERPLSSTTQPNTIEVDDFSFGWAPDPEAAALPVGALKDAQNLIPEHGTDIPKTRFGFTRLATHPINPVTFFDGLDSVTPSVPAGLDDATGLFHGLFQINGTDQATAPPTDIIGATGPMQVTIATRVRNYKAQGQGSAIYTVRVWNVTDNVLVTHEDIVRNPVDPTDYSDDLFFDALPGKVYEPQIVDTNTGDVPSDHRPIAALSYSWNSLADHADGPLVQDSDYYVSQLFDFNDDTPWLIAILTNGLDAVEDNVQLFAINLDTGESQRIDLPGRVWQSGTSTHWGFGIQGVWYGGTAGENMYSWDWRAATWDPTAAINTEWKTYTGLKDDAVDLDAEWPVDYAFDGTERVLFDPGTGVTSLYSPISSIRYVSWVNTGHYQIGDRVSRKPQLPWDAVNTYWKSFVCIKEHDASAGKAPGNGVDTDTYWRDVTLRAPANDFGELEIEWDVVPAAAKTGHAAWFAQRLWLRYDDASKNRLQFSAPLKLGIVRHASDIGVLDFDPTDFAPGSDITGDGGGWIDFEEGDHHNPITAIRTYGQQLVVFKRQSTWVLTGLSEDSFQVRKLASDKGCLGQWANVEHEGLLYFLDEDGLKVTDGTTVDFAPGLDNVREWFRDRLHTLLGEVTSGDDTTGIEATGDQRITLESYHDYVIVSTFDPLAEEQYATVFYHPPSRSFWKTDLPLQSSTHAVATSGDDTLYISTPPGYGYPFVYSFEYDQDQVILYTDDTGDVVQKQVDIPWHMTTSFWPFGVLHEQRRIRSIWAIVRGALDYTVDLSIDWDPTVVASVTRTVSDDNPTHIEGVVVQPDPRAIAFGVSGDRGPASIVGVAMRTEPRRIRYHS